MTALSYDIIRCSSEDVAHPISSLTGGGAPHGTAPTPWFTERRGPYPVEVILRFSGHVQLSQLQILSHESKITSKVEVRVFPLSPERAKNPPSWKDVAFAKLGYVTFNSNAPSGYRAKERKTVHLRAKVYLMKLLFHGPQANPLNTTDQVGVYSIVCLGTVLAPVAVHVDAVLGSPSMRPRPTGEGGAGDVGRSPPRLPPIDGAPVVPSLQRPIHHDDDGLASDRNREPRGFRSASLIHFEAFALQMTEALASRKVQAVEVEDYEAAAMAKATLVQLQQLSAKVQEWEARKVKAIYSEAYDEAKKLKVQMDQVIAEAKRLCEEAEHPQRAPANNGRGGRSGALPPLPAPRTSNTSRFDETPVTSDYALRMSKQAIDPATPDPANSPDSPAVTPRPTLTGLTSFTMDALPAWEGAVQEAIHAASGMSEAELADPLPPSERAEVTQLTASFGVYCAACLLGKRWRLREAALSVIATEFANSNLFPHALPGPSAAALLGYSELKGFGLLDPIVNVFSAMCRVLTGMAEGWWGGEVEALRVGLMGTLPRLILRAADASARARDDAVAVIAAIAAAVGTERVLGAILSDPVDGDGRRIATLGHRLQLARIGLGGKFVVAEGIGTKVVEDVIARLVVPSVNHPVAEVRDAAVALLTTLAPKHGPTMLPMLSKVTNAQLRLLLEERIGEPPPADAVGEVISKVPTKAKHSRPRGVAS